MLINPERVSHLITRKGYNATGQNILGFFVVYRKSYEDAYSKVLRVKYLYGCY